MDYDALEEALHPPRADRRPRRPSPRYRLKPNRRALEMKPAWVRVCEAYIAGRIRVGETYPSGRLYRLCKVSMGLGTAYLQFDLAIHRAPIVLVCAGHGFFRVEDRFAPR